MNLVGRLIQVKSQVICLQSYLARCIIDPDHNADEYREGVKQIEE